MYGQSLFETIAVNDGLACLLEQHIERLGAGASQLGIPFPETGLRDDIEALATEQNRAVIRATLTFGEGGRGYQNPEQAEPNRIVSLHEFPAHPADTWKQGIQLGLVELRLSRQPALAGLKHGNRLEQIIARSQWQANWQEALILDQADQVVEATQSNIFAIKNNRLMTPVLDQCGVAGVMREFVIAQADKIGVKAELVSLSVADIESADAVFLTNSVIGLWPVNQFYQRQFSDFTIAHNLLEIMIENGAIPNI